MDCVHVFHKEPWGRGGGFVMDVILTSVADLFYLPRRPVGLACFYFIYIVYQHIMECRKFPVLLCPSSNLTLPRRIRRTVFRAVLK